MYNINKYWLPQVIINNKTLYKYYSSREIIILDRSLVNNSSSSIKYTIGKSVN